MKILILGAGQVGTSVAHHLVKESNDITIVDERADLLRELQDRLDIRTVVGNASSPDVMFQAGAEDADMVVAVTNSDETNMIACQVAYTVFHTPTKIARIRNADYIRYPSLFAQDALPIDVIISPEALITNYIGRLIDHPGSLQVLSFADDRVHLVGMKAYYGGSLVGQELRELAKHMPGIQTRVAAIYRNGRGIIPNGSTIIEPDDEVFFIAAEKHIRAVTRELRKLDKPYKKIIIAGGGNIGKRLAEALEGRYQIKIIESNARRATALSHDLDKSIVLLGDVADENLLQEESIESTDIFCALTNDDEANILSSMLAKRLGARKVLSIINRPSYVDLVESESIDIAVSPQQVTIGALLAHIRRGDIVAVHSLRRGAAEAIEVVAHGDPSTSKVVGRKISEINLPPNTNIGAIVRGEEVLIATGDLIIESDDHIILFLLEKHHIDAVERLFQVDITFL